MAAFGLAAVIGRDATDRRTGETAATVTDARLQVGGGTKEQLPRGYHLRYTYVVDGHAYLGAAFRTWLDVDDARAKVCFDPRNPADHLLVRATEACGTPSETDG